MTDPSDIFSRFSRDLYLRVIYAYQVVGPSWQKPFSGFEIERDPINPFPASCIAPQLPLPLLHHHSTCSHPTSTASLNQPTCPAPQLVSNASVDKTRTRCRAYGLSSHLLFCCCLTETTTKRATKAANAKTTKTAEGELWFLSSGGHDTDRCY